MELQNRVIVWNATRPYATKTPSCNPFRTLGTIASSITEMAASSCAEYPTPRTTSSAASMTSVANTTATTLRWTM